MKLTPGLALWLRETFASLRIPAYRVFWLAMVATFMGYSVGAVVRGFLVYELTESNAALGAVFFAFGVPMILFALVGGVVADRLPHRLVNVVIQWLFVVSVSIQAALIFTDLIELWMILVGAVFEGIGFALVFPARQALIGDLVDEDDLGNAVALQQVSFNAGRLIVPAVAGVLIAIPLIGIGGTFVVEALLMAVGAAVLMQLPHVAAKGGEQPGSVLADVAEGVRYVRRRPALLILVLMNTAGSNTVFPYVAFVPAVVSDIFDLGSVELGVLLSVIAVGAFVASVGVAWVADREGAWMVHAVSALGFGGLLIAFSVAPAYAVVLAVGIGLGVAEQGFYSLNQSLSMRYCHRDYYGRVQSVLMLGFATSGLAGLPLGLLADALGLRQTMFAMGAVSVTLMLALLLLARRLGARADARLPHDEARTDARLRHGEAEAADPTAAS